MEASILGASSKKPQKWVVDAAGPTYRELERKTTTARTGAASTERLRARRARSSYVGDVAVGVLDPGAVTVALFFESAPR